MDQARKDRIARNEGTFRTTNEALNAGLQDLSREPGELSGFVCVFGNLACTVLVHLDLEEYDAVRSDPRRFVLAPGHEIAEAEEVLEHDERFWVVRKSEDVRAIVEASDLRA